MPACRRAPGFSAQDFHDFIFMSPVQCQECGASIIIEDNAPRLPHKATPISQGLRDSGNWGLIASASDNGESGASGRRKPLVMPSLLWHNVAPSFFVFH